jgi:tRNA threonylcarbamoyladenosine biosynthesis protein TsaE
MIITLQNEQDTALFGAELWRILPKKCVVFLKGDLGAGKTTLTRGVLRAAGYQAVVKSPTYTLVEEYSLADGQLFHFDLYRLKDPEELEWIGMSDYLAQQSLCFIEWPELGQGFLPLPDVELSIKTEGEVRRVDVEVVSKNLKNKLVIFWKNKQIVL